MTSAERLPLQQPFDEKAEKALIGRLLYRPDYFLEVHDMLAPKDFYHTLNQRIFEAFMDCYLAKGKVEYMDIIERKGAIPVTYLHECEELGELYKSTDWAIRTVVEMSSRRRLLIGLRKIGDTIGNRTEDDICNDLLNLATETKRIRGRVYEPEELGIMMYDEMEERRKRTDHVLGHRTGFTIVDNHINGLQGKRLTLITGPTGHGKTALVLNWLSQIGIQQRVPCLFVSVEMKEQDIANRLVGILGGESITDIERGITNSNTIDGIEAIRQGSLFVTDNAPRTAEDVALLIEKFAIRNNIKVWCLDYVGRLDRDKARIKEDRDERFARWVKLLWNVTQRHDLHGVIVSQVNYLEEIAESKKIGHEVDHHFMFKYDREKDINVLECRKNRFGPVGHKYLIEYNKRTQFMKQEHYVDAA